MVPPVYLLQWLRYDNGCPHHQAPAKPRSHFPIPPCFPLRYLCVFAVKIHGGDLHHNLGGENEGSGVSWGTQGSVS